MVKQSNHKNMSFEKDSDEELDVYSDAEFNDINSECGDRYEFTGAGDADDEDMAIYNAEEEVDVVSVLCRLEDPDEMKYIRPARQMPSLEEMHNCWKAVLELEQEEKSNLIALNTIKKWFSFYMVRKQKRLAAQYQQYRVRELAAWKKLTSNKRSILRLEPVESFEVQYAEMTAIKNKEDKILADIKEKERMEKVVADSKIAAIKASLAFKKAGKLRAVKNLGMNKNTQWHSDRRSGSMAVKPIVLANKTEEGQGKRMMRKARLIKEQEEAKKLAEKIAASIAQVKPIVQTVIVQSEQELEALRVEKELEEAEAKAEAEELARYNKMCVEILEKKEKEEKEAIEAEKQLVEDKKAEDEFVELMYKSVDTYKNTVKMLVKKIKTVKKVKKTNLRSGSAQPVTSLLQFNSLIDKAKLETNEKYAKRCDAFTVLSDKTKIGAQLKYTKMCKSVATGKKCYHKDCRFAHDISQLARKDCRFGDGCNFVQHQGNGVYINKIFGRTGKTCDCMHPGEEDKGFCSRMGLKFKPSQATPATPVETVLVVTPPSVGLRPAVPETVLVVTPPGRSPTQGSVGLLPAVLVAPETVLVLWSDIVQRSITKTPPPVGLRPSQVESCEKANECLSSTKDRGIEFSTLSFTLKAKSTWASPDTRFGPAQSNSIPKGKDVLV